MVFVGYIKAKLHGRSNIPDIMLKIIDVYPDGRALNMFDSAQRLRYRNGISKGDFLTLGRTYEVILDRVVTAIKVQTRRHIRVEIASNNFPDTNATSIQDRTTSTNRAAH
jgi:predicted acyl esterase